MTFRCYDLPMSVLLQCQVMCDAGRQLLFIMRHHDQSLVRTLAEGGDYFLDFLAVGEVEAMEWFVENEEFGILDKCTCQQAKTLFAT